MSTSTQTPGALSYALEGAATAVGVSKDVIQRAIRAGDLEAHYPTIGGRPIAKPVLLASELEAWVRRGPTERQP